MTFDYFAMLVGYCVMVALALCAVGFMLAWASNYVYKQLGGFFTLQRVVQEAKRQGHPLKWGVRGKDEPS